MPLIDRASFLSRLLSGTNALCTVIIYHATMRTSSRSTVTIVSQQSTRFARNRAIIKALYDIKYDILLFFTLQNAY